MNKNETLSSTRRILLCASVVLLSAIGTRGAEPRCHKLPVSNAQECVNDAMLTEQTVLGRKSRLNSRAHKVLCIGNSITLHQPLDKVNWYSRSGMAASKPEFDYCHMLEKLMRQHNKKTTVTPVNVANWERDFSLNLDSLLGEKCQGKDMIVIRLSENVQPDGVPYFEQALSKLIEYCQQYTSNIVVTGAYWPHAQKEVAILRNAQRYGLRYVPIDWIWTLHREECCPKEGDTLYDTEGKPYTIKGQFIVTHPNDHGMELIARSIYNSL